jgi:hypothetical protein
MEDPKLNPALASILLGTSVVLPTIIWGASTSTNLSITVTSATQYTDPYSRWSNFPQSSSFFPIAVWLQNPNRPLGSVAPYSTVALSAAAAKINIFLGIDNGGTAWPSGICSGDSNGYLAAIKSVGMYSIPDVNTSNNTSANSISSILCLASSLVATANMVGWNMGDEPQSNCSNVPRIAAKVTLLSGYDSTRPLFENNTDWAFNHGVCSGNVAALQVVGVGSFDLYPITSPWNGGSNIPIISGQPIDSMWIQGYSVVRFIQSGRMGQPIWAYVETGTDELGYSAQNGNTCNADTNLCTPHNNEYRATNEQVNAEAWMSIINGAAGIEWFCHDSLAPAFCLGEQTGGSGKLANSIRANLTYVDTTILSYARQLNSPTVGICTMINGTGFTNFKTSCSNGILTVAAGNSSIPASVLVKSFGSAHYLFAQTARNGSEILTFTLSGDAGKTATVVYDSNAEYDPANSAMGNTVVLNGSGEFSDTFGANSHNYQVKIYTVQ